MRDHSISYNPERSDMPPTIKRPPPSKKKNPAAQALGRLGGSAGTTAQNRARARNAKHAGRPRRVCITCEQPVRLTWGAEGSAAAIAHVDRHREKTCGSPDGWKWQKRSEQ